MKIKYFCAWWGLDHLGLEGMVNKVKKTGFDGIECFVPEKQADKELLRDLLVDNDLELIAHQFQADGGFDDYAESFEKSLRHAASMQPLFINSHTGRDYWSLAQNGKLIAIGEQVAKATGVKILHETHRGRFLYAAAIAAQYFERFPDLKINADFSHWVCVSESLLVGQEAFLAEAIRRTEHIHARVGYEEGPQVPDPFAASWEVHLQTFVGWWQRVVDRFVAEKRDYLTITPEFGPIPYTIEHPVSGKPLTDFFEINCRMKDYLKANLCVSV